MKTGTRFRRGQTAIIMTLAVPALIAAIAFATDIVVLYVNWAKLQNSTDAAVMAGAVYLPSDPAEAIITARNRARTCGIRNDEIVATRVGRDRFTISMTVTRKVNLVTRFLGVGEENIAANSVAMVHAVRSQIAPSPHNLSASRRVPQRRLAWSFSRCCSVFA